MPSPICVFLPGEETPEVGEELDELLTEEIRNQKVVVISIAGRYRQGKSFLMSLIIKYLRAEGASDWLERGNSTLLEGFEWKHTRKRVTRGVLIWPEIFKMKGASGKEVVVILMDTQGVFDTDTTVKASTSIFSLSVLLSSIQIFNVMQRIQGDDFSHMQLFTEFGRLVSRGEAGAQSERKTFQDLTFLVRDWPHSEELAYGWEGGKEYLQEELEKPGLEGELAATRRCLRDGFDCLKCFLMPRPGTKVESSSVFRGDPSEMKPDFVEQMKKFIGDILKPENLKPKLVHGKELTTADFQVFVERYARAMHSNSLPTPKTLYDAHVDAVNSAVVQSSFEMYHSRMSTLIANNPQGPADFERLHDCILEEVFLHFSESEKIGDEIVIEASRKALKRRIDNAKLNFKVANSAAFDKKGFNETLENLLKAQIQLQEQIQALDQSSTELRGKLKEAEREIARLKVEAAKKDEEQRAALAKAKAQPKRKCVIS